MKAKIAKKKAMKEAGEYNVKTAGGDKGRAPKKEKVKNIVNPHTGKRDPNYTQKFAKK